MAEHDLIIRNARIHDGCDCCPVTGPGAVLRRRSTGRLQAAE